jgi:hypothetical protein
MRWVFLILLLAGCAGNGASGSAAPGRHIAFDAALWQAARETIAVFLITASDPVTGTIETGWGGPPDLTGQQYKLLIEIDYTAITSQAVAITARHRLQSGNGWIEVAPDPIVANRLAEAIENRAEELHLRQNPVTR